MFDFAVKSKACQRQIPHEDIFSISGVYRFRFHEPYHTLGQLEVEVIDRKEIRFINYHIVMNDDKTCNIRLDLSSIFGLSSGEERVMPALDLLFFFKHL